jgi:hypothetical protein
MNDVIQISDPITLWVGDKWGLTIPLTSKSGSVTISAVTAELFAEESTSDVLATYASGSVSYTGNNITTPLVGVGTGTILPGNYTLFIHVTFNGGLIVSLIQKFTFLEKKG